MFPMLSRVACSLTLLAAMVVAASGCGGKNGSAEPGKLDKPEEVAAVLPTGVTLETPVVPDKLYGESSKTVAEALANLQARVNDGVLVSGYVGPEIRFDSEPAAKLKPAKTSRTSKTKPTKPPAVIRLAH
jgi:hypothetical protein